MMQWHDLSIREGSRSMFTGSITCLHTRYQVRLKHCFCCTGCSRVLNTMFLRVARAQSFPLFISDDVIRAKGDIWLAQGEALFHFDYYISLLLSSSCDFFFPIQAKDFFVLQIEKALILTFR